MEIKSLQKSTELELAYGNLVTVQWTRSASSVT